jgi:hypothetical protein
MQGCAQPLDNSRETGLQDRLFTLDDLQAPAVAPQPSSKLAAFMASLADPATSVSLSDLVSTTN